MIRWEQGVVQEIVRTWPGVQQLRISLVDPSHDEHVDSGETLTALAYTDVVGTVRVGEKVILNSNAVRRGLGTGGDAFVVARKHAQGVTGAASGHLVKARYTPLQTMVDALDDPEGPHHRLMRTTTDAHNVPVIVADLHSAIPAIVCGVRQVWPEARVVVLHTDGAALPVAFSRSLAQMRSTGWVQAVVSCGQAFGGDAEAVSIHSGILGAQRVLAADVVIAAQGPGNLGSGTPWGFSGVQVAETCHAAAAVKADPIAVLRVSGADPRARHRGLSHHCGTVLGAATFVPVSIAVPTIPTLNDHHSNFHADVAEQLISSVLTPAAERGVHHRVEWVDATGITEALAHAPVHMSTMGRSLEEDPLPFVYAALAGILGAQRSLARTETAP